MTPDESGIERTQIPPKWHDLIRAVQSDVGLDDRYERFEAEGPDHIELRIDHKGLTSTYILWWRALSCNEDANAEAEAREIVNHLLHKRSFREGETNAPSERLLPRHRFMDAFLHAYDLDPQVMLDHIWLMFRERRDQMIGTGRFRWATAADKPAILDNRGGRRRRPGPGNDVTGTVKIPEGLPYIAGDLMIDRWIIDTVLLDERLLLRIEDKSITLSFSDQIPDTIMDVAAGRQLREIVSHPVLDRHDVEIASIRRRGSLTTVWLSGDVIREGWPRPDEADLTQGMDLSGIIAAFAGIIDGQHDDAGSSS